MAKKISENGKPNRKRMLVAPQVPSGPVSDRCIALRATCPSAATMVKGIQREAMDIGGIWATGGTLPSPGRAQCMRANAKAHERIWGHQGPTPNPSQRFRRGGGWEGHAT